MTFINQTKHKYYKNSRIESNNIQINIINTKTACETNKTNNLKNISFSIFTNLEHQNNLNPHSSC